MRTALRRNGNEPGGDVGKHFFVVGISRNIAELEALCKRLRLFGYDVAYRGDLEPAVGCRKRGFYVIRCDPAAAYKCIFHF